MSAAIIGAAVTTGIAWTAMFVPWGAYRYGPRLDIRELGLTKDSAGGTLWQINEGRNAWHHVVQYWHMQMSGQSFWIPIADYEARKFDLANLPWHLRPASVDELNMMAWYREVGWPMKALTCSVHWKTQVANSDIIYTVRGGVQLPRDEEFHPRALPMTPVWLGFMADTLAWAGVWLGAGWMIGEMKRRIRARRGRCVECGYLLKGLPRGATCPECGRGSSV